MSLLTAWYGKKGRYFVQDCCCKLNTVKYLRAKIYSLLFCPWIKSLPQHIYQA